MARPKQALPSYQFHKSTGQARTYIDGRDYYLGEYGSDESRVRYGNLIARVASGQTPVDPMAMPKVGSPTDKPEVDPGPSVDELCISFWRHAEQHYVKNGKPTSEVHCYRSAINCSANCTAESRQRTLDRWR